jgi:murein L,D-transpeptidase YafK
MFRAVVILLDIVVTAGVFVSLALMIFYPVPSAHTVRVVCKPVSQKTPRRENVETCDIAETNRTVQMPDDEKNRTKRTKLTIEEILALSTEVAKEEYVAKHRYIYVDLKERMHTLGLEAGKPIFIRIFKTESILEIWMEKEDRYVHLKDYEICAWSGRLGPKLKEGDRQSPEGFYRVYRSSLNPHSRFHLSFNLGYPNAYDRAHGRTGSYLMVHGDCRSIGCYAMTDRNIDEIYMLVNEALRHGQAFVPVHIFPFRLDDETITAHEGHRWFDFWMNLKEGYDYFETERRPPRIEVEHGRYIVTEGE